MTSVTIATDADLEAVVALVNSGYRGESSRAGWTTEADYLDGQRTDVATLREELASHQDAVVLLLRDEPSTPLLGSVWLERKDEHTWYLGMFTVRPDLQNQQLGRTLLHAAERFVAERGARRMVMSVISVRDTLIAWYERRGYRRTGAVKPFPYGDPASGEPLRDDLVLVEMEKAL